ncbi:hypothetical protein H6G54_06785 [Anabaena cylindrica FACHB-243]|uniref:Uncharacterized protein n=1 Tax=Anabaena cylindrica (strain ATCC 27899 / PCC 7122) TaxID=272123 RepID=K9ZAI0_ANACC|nr:MULTISPECIES: hypothetical protein [Anabaena]AFZ56188.1 hypothetical protein Anacy_0595 [Anabaena cylindrica PCC 7122]MBD2417416.1 hypothetical protein [Anabaena cylindrica FACHB-243]MBY5284428.1 hypothetical protein [Anabaena sp. CCAP 1446/1C]MBY5306263.1 hypothetical protein [Anabaena sp. CCAP 1446/1C]MCM2407585.1 hypothetical protein [Anabaena sp. CCAP 1446/1C]
MTDSSVLIMKMRQQILSLSLTLYLAASQNNDTEEEIKIPPLIISIAKRGLALHEEFGGGRNIAVAKGLTGQRPLTLEDLNKIVDFFETHDPDYNDPGWSSARNPSGAWIRWCLMGGNGSWAREMKEEIEKDKNPHRFRFVVPLEQPIPKTHQPSQGF